MKLNTTLQDVIDFEMDILLTYVNRVESDVSEGIKSYKPNINIIHEEVEETDNVPFYRAVEECEGLNNSTINFQSVFEEYFPQLQRSSALITLCSFFEHRMVQICNDLQRANPGVLKLKVAEISSYRNRIKSAITYFTKIVGIEFDEGGKDYFEINNIQSIRNCFVHNDGLFPKEMKDYVNKNEYLSGDTTVCIHNGYLKHVVICYKIVFEKIQEELTNKYKDTLKVALSK